MVKIGPAFFDYVSADEFGYADEMESYGVIPVTPGMIVAVIQFLKTIFETIKNKRAKGEPLTADEQEIFDMAPEIEQGLGEAKEAASQVITETESQAASIEAKGAQTATAVIESAAASESNGGGAGDIIGQAEKAAENLEKGGSANVKEVLKASETSTDDSAEGSGSMKKILIVVVILVVIFLLYRFFGK